MLAWPGLALTDVLEAPCMIYGLWRAAELTATRERGPSIAVLAGDGEVDGDGDGDGDGHGHEGDSSEGLVWPPGAADQWLFGLERPLSSQLRPPGQPAVQSLCAGLAYTFHTLFGAGED